MNSKKPKVLVVGTFHMGQTADMVQTNFDRGLSPKREADLQSVVNQFAQFQPTKIAVEVVPEKEEKLNNDYLNYLNGCFELPINEINQLGFRLAAQLKHDKLHAIDWMDNIGQRGIGDVLQWAKQNQPSLYDIIVHTYLPQLNTNVRERSMADLLKWYNSPERLALEQEMYLQVARIGQDNEYVGIDWLRWWYQRNLTIFSNVSRLVQSPEERIILLIGSAHVYLVSQFMQQSNQFELQSLHNYIKCN